MYTIKITLRETRCTAVLEEQVPVTTGSRGQFQVLLDADEGWAGLNKTVIFYTGFRTRAVYLGGETSCLVPPDVLQSPAAMLTVGVQGMQGDTVRCSTLAQVTGLTPGAYIPAEEDPTTHPDLYSQLLAEIESIRSAISSVSSVNGQTGAVTLDAASVGARPDSWMPTASEVGALPADTVFPTELPAVTTGDAGKFLRVSEAGAWAAEALSSAEGGSY